MPQDAPFLPSLRDPDNLIYFRQEVSGLLMGGYERTSKAWSADYNNIDNIPANFNNSLLAEDWDRFTDIAEASQKRVPKMAEVGIKSFINGPEGFTPDNEFCLGETSVGGFFVAAGFCAHGIAGAGGIGKVVAEWVVAGEPTMDLWHMDIKRFGASYESPDFTLQRITENYEQYYDIHYPSEERKSARPKFVSPVYEWHKAQGAVFGEKSSWERVNFYSTNIGNDALRPKDWLGNHWSNAVQVEHNATLVYLMNLALLRPALVACEQVNSLTMSVQTMWSRVLAKQPIRKHLIQRLALNLTTPSHKQQTMNSLLLQERPFRSTILVG
jgi:4-methylaminobutanoate oxidase (formaldehyde-forming)